ncbi:MAG: potassium channel family protein [Victivallales bacterium]|jgi:voltage-gated potassium channel
MSSENNNERPSLLQLAMLILSIYVIGALIAQTFFKFSVEMNDLLNKIDSLICLVFLYDFFFRLYRAPSKLAFLKWGWIDFVSSIPMLPYLRWGRIVRIVRIIRVLRAFRSTKILVGYLYNNRAKGAFASVILISTLLVIFSSIAMLNFETDKESNIKTPIDAIWWSLTTITTVGYGDRYPITFEGRLIAIILMFAGVGLFGTFTAFITRIFIESDQRNEKTEISELVVEIKNLNDKIECLDKKIEDSFNRNSQGNTRPDSRN